jgi:hypothetical protein
MCEKVYFGVTRFSFTQPVSMAPKVSQASSRPKNILKIINGALSIWLNRWFFMGYFLK